MVQTEPCGTPEVTGAYSENDPLITTHWYHFERKPLSHNNLPPTPRDSSFKSRHSCGTESNALEKSENRQWTVEHCSSVIDQSSKACSNKAVVDLFC